MPNNLNWNTVFKEKISSLVLTYKCLFVGCIYCPKVTQSTLISRRSIIKVKNNVMSNYQYKKSQELLFWFVKTDCAHMSVIFYSK